MEVQGEKAERNDFELHLKMTVAPPGACASCSLRTLLRARGLAGLWCPGKPRASSEPRGLSPLFYKRGLTVRTFSKIHVADKGLS